MALKSSQFSRPSSSLRVFMSNSDWPPSICCGHITAASCSNETAGWIINVTTFAFMSRNCLNIGLHQMVINIIDFLIFSSQVIDELLTSAFYIQATKAWREGKNSDNFYMCRCLLGSCIINGQPMILNQTNWDFWRNDLDLYRSDLVVKDYSINQSIQLYLSRGRTKQLQYW